MKISHRFNSTSALRAGSYAVLASLVVPLAGCGSPASPPASSGQGQMQPAMNRNTGLSTKQKVVLLAGAAALYYYYRRAKASNEAKYKGQQIQYYLSKNGRVYYRDPANPKNVVWVTPPPAQARTVSIPQSEAQNYQDIQGYNNQNTGNQLDYYFNGPQGAESMGR